MAIPIGTRANGTAPRQLDLTPVIPVVGRMLSGIDILPALKGAVNCIDCRPLQNVTLVSLSSIPYVAAGNNRVVKTFENGLSARLRYLEVAVTSTASLIYNAAFSLVFTVLSLVTLGQVQMIVDQMRKHWMHTGLATGAIGISVVGTVSPELGAKLTVAALLGVGVAVLRGAQGDLVSKIGRGYQRHRQELKDAIFEGVQRDRAFFDRTFTPLFNYLDAHLNEQLQSVRELVRVIEGAEPHLPTHILPTGNARAAVGHLQSLFSNVRPTEATV